MDDRPSLDLGELGRLLQRVAPHKTVPEVMGALTALASAPASPHPSQWLLTLTDDARFEDETDARDFLQQVLGAYRELDALLQMGEAVGPDAEDPLVVAQWCRGYFQTARNDATWSADTDSMRRLMPLALLAGELDRVGQPGSGMHGDAMRSKWTAALGDLASSFYTQWADARAKHRPQPPREDEPSPAPDGDAVPFKHSAPKLGRNAPCHCGSGKKFKQCHGKP
ncbi:MAG: UPF0149 family protein [Nannocystales bacterium]